jgi:hypothetical protein
MVEVIALWPKATERGPASFDSPDEAKQVVIRRRPSSDPTPIG